MPRPAAQIEEHKRAKLWRWFLVTITAALFPFIGILLHTLAQPGAVNLTWPLFFGHGDLFPSALVLAIAGVGELIAPVVKHNSWTVFLIVVSIFIVLVCSCWLPIVDEAVENHHQGRVVEWSIGLYVAAAVTSLCCVAASEDQK